MMAALSVTMLMIMVITAGIGIKVQLPGQQCVHCLVRVPGHTAIQRD